MSQRDQDLTVSRELSPAAGVKSSGGAELVIWLVNASVGEWSDRSEWTAAAFLGETDAKAYVEHISAQARLAPEEDDRWKSATDTQGKYGHWLAHMETIDAGFSTYFGDPPTYTAYPITVHAGFDPNTWRDAKGDASPTATASPAAGFDQAREEPND